MTSNLIERAETMARKSLERLGITEGDPRFKAELQRLSTSLLVQWAQQAPGKEAW